MSDPDPVEATVNWMQQAAAADPHRVDLHAVLGELGAPSEQGDGDE